MMTCQSLAATIERLQPEAEPRDVARLCLLLANTVDDLNQLDDDHHFANAWHQTGWRLQAASDQHAAMTAELEELAETDPETLDQNQIVTLLRAIKVQSQVLQLYIGKDEG
jgi:hypothetical protein